jgi:4-amino-4-deoxy-L-arabinose transferase-like glycosyltransferase
MRIGPYQAAPLISLQRRFLAAFKRIPPQWLLLSIIMVVGAAFRFMALGEIRHGYDEGYPAYEALRILDGRQLMLTSQPSSVFLDNPPLMAYLQTIPLLLWRSVWSAYFFITALNTIAIWFVYQTTRKILSDRAALLAAFLFAISPWVVHYSRMPWVQGLLPLLTAVVAWGLWPVMVTKKGPARNVFIAMLAVTAMTLSYILGIAILLPVAVLILIYFRDIPKRPLYAGLLILIISLILFGVGISRNEERNSANLQSFISANEIGLNTQALEHAVRFVTGLDYESQSGMVEETIPLVALSRLAYVLLGLGLLAGVIRALLSLRRGGQNQRLGVVLLVWFLAPVLGLLFLPYLVHPHYLLLSLPAGQVLAAWGVVPLFRQPRWRSVGIVTLLAIACLFGLNIRRAGQAVVDSPSGDSFNGWALADIATIGDTIRELASGSGFPRRIVAEDNSPLLSGISATYVDSMSELDYPDFMLLPGQEPLLYVFLNREPESTLLGSHEQSFPDRTIQVADGTTVSFVRLLPYERDQALLLPQTTVDWTSDAGLTFLGYTLETLPPYRAGHSFVVTTYWRVEGLNRDRLEWLVTPYIQVLNADWQIMANESSRGQWGYRWQLGDVYIQRQTVPLPDYVEPGEHQLLIGLSNPIDETSFALNSPSGPVPFYLAPLHVDE